MKAAILGCGPAGLLAALAAEQHGYEPVVLSKKRPSILFGAQYLHRAIPELKLDSSIIDYSLNGTHEQYRAKQYGKLNVTVSPDTLEAVHMGWDIRAAYGQLWSKYGDDVQDIGQIKGEDMNALLAFLVDDIGADIVFSTLPRMSICVKPNEHEFVSVQGYAYGDDEKQGRVAPFRPAGENIVLCDGTPDVGWYRLSRVFGCTTIEWPNAGAPPPVAGVGKFFKPISTNCNCHWWINHLGRFGRWEKGVLTSDAYDDAVAAVIEGAGLR